MSHGLSREDSNLGNETVRTDGTEPALIDELQITGALSTTREKEEPSQSKQELLPDSEYLIQDDYQPVKTTLPFVFVFCTKVIFFTNQILCNCC